MDPDTTPSRVPSRATLLTVAPNAPSGTSTSPPTATDAGTSPGVSFPARGEATRLSCSRAATHTTGRFSPAGRKRCVLSCEACVVIVLFYYIGYHSYYRSNSMLHNRYCGWLVLSPPHPPSTMCHHIYLFFD